ncbi:MAG: hypothetical protein KIH08_10170 [Candidatus Freyarchaeota archaeon]|nr:hypothetical protein [Candidatus Jordarchaeia archaeon]
MYVSDDGGEFPKYDSNEEHRSQVIPIGCGYGNWNFRRFQKGSHYDELRVQNGNYPSHSPLQATVL